MNSFLSGSVNTHWARAGKYKLGTRAGKHKLGTRAGGWGRGLGQGPGNTNTLILE